MSQIRQRNTTIDNNTTIIIFITQSVKKKKNINGAFKFTIFFSTRFTVRNSPVHEQLLLFFFFSNERTITEIIFRDFLTRLWNSIDGKNLLYTIEFLLYNIIKYF